MRNAWQIAWPMLLAIAAGLCLVEGIRQVNFEENSLTMLMPQRSAVSEARLTSSQPDSFVARVLLVHATTWQVIKNDRDLSEEMIEESYACTAGVPKKKYQEIQDTRIEGNTEIKLVLKLGACRQPVLRNNSFSH